MRKYAIELKNIDKAYEDGDDKNQVLNNVSLQVGNSEFAAIVGPSGSGKSTLLSIAGALLSPDQGEIMIGGENIASLQRRKWTKIRREKIGFIFQSHQLLPYLTVEEQLTMVGNLSGRGKKAQAEELLEELGLSSSRKKYPQQLSGGEKQRTAIARALMNDPDVILADEPTASLDKERGFQVVDMIRREVKKRNKAAIMVTHDERVLGLMDTVYTLENGVLLKAE